jgi:hypothetical protein
MGGSCQCKPGLERCGGRCVDVQTDPNRCGACDAQCNDDQVCNGGNCACRPGLDLCGGSCVDLQSDPDHCGDCGTTCAADERCNAGTCESTTSGSCPNDTCDLGNGRQACVDFQTDPQNCGDCGNTCNTDEICVDRNCRNYAVALTCNSCPCDQVCNRLVDSNTCCPGGLGSGSNALICVDSGSCP